MFISLFTSSRLFVTALLGVVVYNSYVAPELKIGYIDLKPLHDIAAQVEQKVVQSTLKAIANGALELPTLNSKSKV